MVTIREIRGYSHSFPLANGDTFHILAYSEKEIAENLVGEDLRKAADMKLISIREKKTKPPVENN